VPSRRASVAAWVDFPVPSPPSRVMKRPAIAFLLLERLGTPFRRR
jgi:hypothetical protein